MLPLLLTLSLLLPLAYTQRDNQPFPPGPQQGPGGQFPQQPTQTTNPGPSNNQQNPLNQQNPANTQNVGGAQRAAPNPQAQCFQRVSWTTMTPAAKTGFIDRLLELKANGEYDKLTQKHLDEAASTHGVTMFLPYHRYLLHALEIALGQAIPYWDWSADSQAPHLADVFGNDYFGGNGGVGNCVETGKFTVANGWSSTVGTTGCLQRCFDGGDTIQAFSPPEFSAAFTSSSQTYEQFRNSIEGSIHAQIHNALGKRCNADMAQLYSPNDPIFWLHHSNVDRLFYRWQMSCKAYGSTMPGQTHSYPTDLNANIFGTTFKIFDAMPGGGLCHNYAQAGSDVALQPNCPPDPADIKETPTATESAPVPTEAAGPLGDVNINDAASGWFVNQIRFLVPQESLGRNTRKRMRNTGSLQLNVDPTIADNATSIRLEKRSDHTLHFNFKKFQNIKGIGGAKDHTHLFGNNAFSFQTQDDVDDMEDFGTLVPPPGLHDYHDLTHCRHPPPLSEDYCRMMNLDVERVRSLEEYQYGLIDSMNGIDDYESPGSLHSQFVSLEKIGHSEGQLNRELSGFAHLLKKRGE